MAYAPDVTGGAERQAHLQAEALQRRGHRVTVVCRRNSEQPRRHEVDEVVVHRLGSQTQPLDTVAFIFSLAVFMVLNVRRFDAVHVHALRLPGNLAAWIALALRRPVYVKVAAAGEQGEVAYWSRGWRRRFSVLSYASRVQALTGVVADQFLRAGVRPERILHIPNGIDLVRFRPAAAVEKAQARRELGLPSEGVIVLYCGTFQPIKGTPELLAAWERLTPTDATLVLVGQPANGYRLPAARGVVVMPWQDDVAPYYRAADVFVLPSHAEGMSNALLEALASGLAVIATRVGAAETLIADPEQGLLVPPADIEALATALRGVIDDPGLRARLMKRGPSAVQHLAIDTVVETIEAAYNGMLKSEAAGKSARQSSYRKH